MPWPRSRGHVLLRLSRWQSNLRNQLNRFWLRHAHALRGAWHPRIYPARHLRRQSLAEHWVPWPRLRGHVLLRLSRWQSNLRNQLNRFWLRHAHALRGAWHPRIYPARHLRRQSLAEHWVPWPRLRGHVLLRSSRWQPNLRNQLNRFSFRRSPRVARSRAPNDLLSDGLVRVRCHRYCRTDLARYPSGSPETVQCPRSVSLEHR